MRDFDACASIKSNIYEAEFENNDSSRSPNAEFINDEERNNHYPLYVKQYPLHITDDLDKEIDIVLQIEIGECGVDFSASIELWFDGTYDGTSFQHISRKSLYHLLKYPTFRRFVENSIFIHIDDWNSQCATIIPAFEGQNGRGALWDCVYYKHQIYIGKEKHSNIKFCFPCTEKVMNEIMEEVEEELERMVDYFEGESNERL